MVARLPPLRVARPESMASQSAQQSNLRRSRDPESSHAGTKRTGGNSQAAVTVMFGLGFATVLTMVVVPNLFAIFYKVKSPARAQ